MVIGLLMIAAIPTVTGVAQAISAQKTEKERQKDANRMKRFHIDVECDAEDPKVREIRGHRLVLNNDRVWIGPPLALNPCPAGYVAEAFYIEYPDNERIPVPLGLVSQVADDPPLLNWIYVDKDTMELKYGNKSKSITHIVGPWDWTEDESAIMFEELESFTAVEDPTTKKWQVYVDMRDDSPEKIIPKGRRKLQIRLKRTLIPET